jgi:threonylcarbamoyladenosine tRNA methylthiotransferase MtaB
LEKVELLRKYFQNPAITTDIIVGFPGETDTEFATTCDFAKQVSFAQIHVFKYSRRQGTVADGMEGQVPEQEKSLRSDRLITLAGELERDYQQTFSGCQEQVLFEEITEIDGGNYLIGHNTRYVRIAVPVEDVHEPQQWCNRIVEVSIEGRISSEVLLGKVL